MSGSVNKVILLGRLGADVECRTFQNGGQVVNLRIATSESWRDKNSGERQERTQWHQVAIFSEPVGKIATQYLRKGSRVYIEGQIETRKYQDQSGADRYTTEVVIRPFNGTLTLLDGKSDGDARSGMGGEPSGGSAGTSGYGAGYDAQMPQGGAPAGGLEEPDIPF